MMILKNILIVAIVVLFCVLGHTQTKVIAHRGFSSIAPENTWIAFQKAIEIGADYFELDVHKTSDGAYFVIHDKSIDRTSSNGEKGTIFKMTTDEIVKVRVGYPEKFGDTFKNERIPSLKEILFLAKGKIKVCIEIKIYGIEKDVLKIIDDLDMNDEVIIFSFYYTVLAKIRQLNKEIPILLLHPKYLIDEVTIDYAQIINANAIGVNYESPVSKELVDFAHKNGIEIWKWAINDEEQIKELIDIGIDGLITDYPDKALKIIKKMATNTD